MTIGNVMCLYLNLVFAWFFFDGHNSNIIIGIDVLKLEVGSWLFFYYLNSCHEPYIIAQKFIQLNWIDIILIFTRRFFFSCVGGLMGSGHKECLKNSPLKVMLGLCYKYIQYISHELCLNILVLIRYIMHCFLYS
jgi:hypothetical protein